MRVVGLSQLKDDPTRGNEISVMDLQPRFSDALNSNRNVGQTP